MITERGTVNVNTKNAEGKTVKLSRDYDRVVLVPSVWRSEVDENGKITKQDPRFLDADGVPLDVGTLLKNAIDAFSTMFPKKNGVLALLDNAEYGLDLKRKSPVRQAILAAAEGPEKAINTAFEKFNAARGAMGKKLWTIERYREFMASDE